MTIVMVIAIVVMSMCVATLTYRLNQVEKKADISVLDAYTKTSVKVANVNFDSVANAIKQQRADIDSIIEQMEAITADIGRLDGEVAQVKKDEREIRAYYVNFRQPKALPVYDTGVPWAKDFPCNDEHE